MAQKPFQGLTNFAWLVIYLSFQQLGNKAQTFYQNSALYYFLVTARRRSKYEFGRAADDDWLANLCCSCRKLNVMHHLSRRNVPMIILQTLKWALIVVLAICGTIAAVVAAFLLFALAEHLLYTLSRYRTLKALEKVHALKAKFAAAIATPDRNNPLMRGLSIPLSRFDAAVATLARRAESLQHNNDVRQGPHARKEWRYLRKDVKAVLRRGRQLDYFTQAPDARDGIWPFAADYSAIYADENYAGREPYAGTTNIFTGEANSGIVPPHLRRGHRNWAVNRGALDEDVMPSAEERRQAQMASVADIPGVTVLKTAAKTETPAGIYDKTGKVLPFERRRRVDVKA